MMNRARRRAGFTLIELAVALFIVALMLGGLLGPMAARIEQSDRSATDAKLVEIKEALYGFAVANGRLPCPNSVAPFDGMEDPCAGGFSIGRLPYAMLGVDGVDAWAQPYTYGVETSFADNIDGAAAAPGGVAPSCTATPAPGISFELCSNASGQVMDGVGGMFLVIDAPAIVVSHGTNWGDVPPPGSDEGENRNADNVLVDAGYRRNPNNPFDDMLMWLSPAVLKNRMVQAGLLP